jgi:hypothetical protein
MAIHPEFPLKEVQDTSCQGFGGVPHPFQFPPKIWGAGGLIIYFSTLFIVTAVGTFLILTEGVVQMKQPLLLAG